MSRLLPCKTCGTFRKAEGACPSCGGVHLSTGATSAALLLGLALAAGCGPEDTDTGVQALYGVVETDTNDTDDTDGEDQAMYGVAETDAVDTDGEDEALYGVADTDG